VSRYLGVAGVCCLGLMIATRGHAQPPSPTLAALAPADDARRSIALGPGGEVYAPDGNGAWVRTQRITTASKLAIAGRAGSAVVANGDGVVYRLAPNGWSAIRLAQKGAAVMSGGSRAVAAVKRQLYSLDRTAGGEPAKLGVAGGNVLAIGSGKAIVVATDRGLYRIAGGKVTAIAGAPKQVSRLVSDRWALVGHGALDLRSNKTSSWPAGMSVGVAAAGPDDELVAVATIGGKLELVTLRGTKLEREPIAIAPIGTAVGVVLDRGGRVVVALGDGRLLVRERGTWTSTTVREELPLARPGPAPATSQ